MNRLLPLVFALAMAACKPATQVTFDIKTDVPCDKLSGTSITVGLEGETERADPWGVTPACRQDGTVGAIGTFAVVPKAGGVQTRAAIKVVVAVGDGLSVEQDCNAARGYAGCIVARRRVSFVPSRGLTIPIELYLICSGIVCDENSTCNRAGKCVSSLVDQGTCDDAGFCSGLEMDPDGGLPCLNQGTAEPLYCAGDNAWCTQTVDGVRSCRDAPVTVGLSYQCRDSRDCGPNLVCVAGENGVLGRCLVTALPTQTVLCQLGQPNTPCADGPRACNVDAGPGLYSCGTSEKPPDGGGLPCPREGPLHCFGSKPYCSQFNQTAECVADGGAQCWYNSDCPTGQRCYAGISGRFTNLCADAPTPTNPVALCNPGIGDTDCPDDSLCNGEFYGVRACRQPACAPGFDDCYGTGRDGPLVVPSNSEVNVNVATNVVQPVSAGFDVLQVTSTDGFDAGDLVMVWQTRGLPDGPGRGDSDPVSILDAGIGHYEGNRVRAVVDTTTVRLQKPLIFSYASAGAQLVRIPEYTTVEIQADAGIVGSQFDFFRGGIVAFLAKNGVTNEGRVDVTGRGSRGGINSTSVTAFGCTQLDGDATMGGGARQGSGLMVTNYYREGIGRVANAGGGGGCLNAGGGGGGLGGFGGKGGASISTDGSRDVGGWGGGAVILHELQLVHGGGGGAGQPDDNGSTAGGNGGGVILIHAGSVVGNGLYLSRGSNPGVSSVDGEGGGGSGGLVDLRSANQVICGGIDVSGGDGMWGYAAGCGGSGGGGIIRVRAGDHSDSRLTCVGNVSAGAALPSPGPPVLTGHPGGPGLDVRR